MQHAWAPLRIRLFRVLWLTQAGSMLGTWMHNVGAQWLLVDEPGAETLVAMVQAAAMLPVLVLAMPAGALADIVDRRRLLLGVQTAQVATCAVLVWLTVAGWLGPASLLTITFLLGCGITVTLPGYQSLVQDIVPRAELRSVAALNGVAMNLARAVGPPVAGVLIAQTGIVTVFVLNGLSYVAFVAALLWIRRPPSPPNRLPERFGGALRAGARYVRHAPIVRRMLVRCLLFVVPGAALWALLPLVASRLLGLDAAGYGLTLGALGAGAIAGAFLLPRITDRISPNRLLAAGGLVFAAATAVCVLVPNAAAVIVVLVPAGLAWLAVLATLNGLVQTFLPSWVRARGLSIYQVAFAGGQALASIVWGLLAQFLGLVPALLIAAGVMAVCALSVLVLPLRDTTGMDRESVAYWPEPRLDFDPDLDEGPILVTRSYTVLPERAEAFLEAWAGVRRMRLRTGATRCAIYRDGADPDRYFEIAIFPTWAEHLRQHEGRLTGSDQAAEEAALELAESMSQVDHLFPPHVVMPADGDAERDIGAP